ncbi:hypothetical protein [Frankia sp. CiP3]|uniref:hypothetical protein n=1 Tax=Frankia sp. CiP3 TaxID=2880971 RepID=UPI001EF4B7E0|nr:hypothetical protein [Frankia sp. CiP3]
MELWLSLDPTVEFWIADLKGVGDWAMFEGVATRLIEGPTNEHVISAAGMLEDTAVEMNHRIEVKRSGGKFRPPLRIVDEAQVAFGCTAQDEDKNPYGGTQAKSRYFMAAKRLHDQGRTVDVLLHQGTRDPTDQNLPKRKFMVMGRQGGTRADRGETRKNNIPVPPTHLIIYHTQ